MNPWGLIIVGSIFVLVGTIMAGYGWHTLSSNNKRLEEMLSETKEAVIAPVHKLNEQIAKNNRSIEKGNSESFINQSELRKPNVRMGGIILEGQRSNLIPSDYIQILEKHHLNKVSSRKSKIAPSSNEAHISLKSDEIVELDFIGIPTKNRSDYTFSFLTYSDSNSLDSVSIEISITDNNDKKSFIYNVSDIDDYTQIETSGIKYYRPELPYQFSNLPKKINCTIRAINKSKDPLSFSIVYPVLEEGLFASSPIEPGKYRAVETLKLDLEPTAFGSNSNSGTISFLFKPTWSSSRLTPGINPHLLYWVSDDEQYGLIILSDSKDNGRFKVITIANGNASIITSDITPLKETIYAFDIRFMNQKVELVINGRNISSTTNIQMPNSSLLGKSLYIGVNPKSDDASAFGVIRDFRIYGDWLDLDQINKILSELVPNQFAPINTK